MFGGIGKFQLIIPVCLILMDYLRMDIILLYYIMKKDGTDRGRRSKWMVTLMWLLSPKNMKHETGKIIIYFMENQMLNGLGLLWLLGIRRARKKNINIQRSKRNGRIICKMQREYYNKSIRIIIIIICCCFCCSSVPTWN